MEGSYDAGFESEDSNYENERPVMTEKEKIAIDGFLKSVFERVLVLMKNEIETQNDGSEEERIVLTSEEEKVIGEFLDKIFKRAIEIVRKEISECTSDTSDGEHYKDDIDKEESQSDEKTEEDETTGASQSIKRRISEALRQGLHLPGHRAPKVKPEQEVKTKSSVEEDEDKINKEFTSRDKDEFKPYEGFVSCGGKNINGEHIIYIDPMKAPQDHEVGDHTAYLRLLDNLLAFTDNFIAENTNGSPFILIYRCLDVPHSHGMKITWMARLYGTLRDRYLEKLEKLIVYKPEIKLKALVKICKPFLRRELSRKVMIVTDPVSLAQELCLPQVIPGE